MDFFGLAKLFSNRGQAQSEPQIECAHLDFAYACEDCLSIVNGVTNGRCRRCGSQSVFHIKSLLNQVQNRAKQRLELARRMKAAGLKNELNTLTDFRAPDEAA